MQEKREGRDGWQARLAKHEQDVAAVKEHLDEWASKERHDAEQAGLVSPAPACCLKPYLPRCAGLCSVTGRLQGGCMCPLQLACRPCDRMQQAESGLRWLLPDRHVQLP